MLCAKNLKAVKAALIMILGAGWAVSAQAQMDLTSTEMGGLANHAVAVYAAETIKTGSTGPNRNFSTLSATGGAFTVDANIGYVLPADTYYIRYDLEAPDGVVAHFVNIDGATTIPLVMGTDEATPTGRGTATEFDVDDNASTIIYELAVTGAEENDVFRLDLNGVDPDDTDTLNTGQRPARVQISGSSAGGNYKVMLRIRVYDSVPGATNAGASTYLNAAKPIIAVDNTLSLTVGSPAKLTASVAEGFKKFEGGAASGTLAMVNADVQTMHFPARGHAGWEIMSSSTGMQVGLGDVMGNSAVHVNGNFAVGTFKVGSAGAMLVDANDKELEKHTSGDDKGKYIDPALAAQARFTVGSGGTAAAVTGAPGKMRVSHAFTVDVGAKNDDTIPASKYSATTAAKAKDSQAAAIAAVTGQDAGEIKRDGTTVHLGYLTTYEGHNQRLVMVNRGPLNVGYEMEFVAEDGTTAMPGHMASGELMPKSTTVIQVRDLVSFAEGGTTRASATLSMTANPNDISVATTLVNTMDRSTDTVVYDAQD